MNATILSVDAKTREWDNPKGGKVVFVSGILKDDIGEAGWSTGCDPGREDARKAEMTALIGKPGDFILEQGKDYNGRRQFKLKLKGGAGGFGGKGFREPSFDQTEAGFWAKQKDIRRAVALKEAVASHAASGAPSDVILETAGKFLAFLSAQDAPTAPKTEKAAPPAFDAQKAATAALAMLDPIADRGTDALVEAWKRLSKEVQRAIKDDPKHNAAFNKLKEVAANVMPGE